MLNVTVEKIGELAVVEVAVGIDHWTGEKHWRASLAGPIDSLAHKSEII